MAVRFTIAKITSAIFIFFLTVVPVFAESTMKALATKDVLVVFENGREETAREVVDLFLLSVRELKEQWNWIPEKRPEILLTNDRQSFFRNMPNPRFIAYAVPNRNLIVIDTLSALKEPFTLGTTLKHELVHIMLHYRTGGNAPRWLDEGIAQWATSGIAEIIKDPRLKVLERAALTGRFIRLRDLEQYFPADDTALLLAYEESLSVVDYILSVYGNSALVDLVDRLDRGQLIGEAIRDSLGLSYETLEENWRRRLQRNMSWAAYGARNITAILFFFMALVTVAAFIRFLIKKRQYKDGDDEEEETSDGNGLH